MAARNRELTEARRTVRDLKEQRRKHKQLCSECTQLRHDRARFCDEGWALHKKIRDAETRLSGLAEQAAGQGVL